MKIKIFNCYTEEWRGTIDVTEYSIETGRNRGKKITMKYPQIRDISLVPVGKGIISSKRE